MEIDRIRWDKFSDLLFDRRWKRVSAEGTQQRLSRSGVISVIKRAAKENVHSVGEEKDSGRWHD